VKIEKVIIRFRILKSLVEVIMIICVAVK